MVATYASLCNCGFDMDAWRKKGEEGRLRDEMEEKAQELEDRIKREEIARQHEEGQKDARGGLTKGLFDV